MFTKAFLPYLLILQFFALLLTRVFKASGQRHPLGIDSAEKPAVTQHLRVLGERAHPYPTASDLDPSAVHRNSCHDIHPPSAFGRLTASPLFQASLSPDGKLQGPRSPRESLPDSWAVVVSEVPPEVFSSKGEEEPAGASLSASRDH